MCHFLYLIQNTHTPKIIEKPGLSRGNITIFPIKSDFFETSFLNTVFNTSKIESRKVLKKIMLIKYFDKICKVFKI